jgi:hypothetical protein
MRRSTAALILVVLLCLTVACGGHGSTGLTITAQTQKLSGAWGDGRTMQIDCRTAAGTRGQLCDAVAYYLAHRPSHPCYPIGTTARPSRILISGELGSQAVDATMTTVCNPPKHLGQAVGTIYTAVAG